MVSDDGTISALLTAFQQVARAAAELEQRTQPGDGPSVADVLREHLGVDPRSLAVVTEAVPTFREIDADVALEVVIARHGGGRLVGIGGGEQRMHNSFSEIVEHAGRFGQFLVGAVDFSRAATGPDSERRTVAFGLHLFAYDGVPVGVLQRSGSPRHGMQSALEVICGDEQTTLALLGELRETMVTHSVLRGQVVSFTQDPYGPSAAGMTFLPRTPVPEEHVILPPGTLARIERQVLGVAQHRDALRAAGQHLKRGVLLYGPPGTGKTHTVRHLVGASDGTTVIVLAGSTLRLVGLAAETARVMQPAIVVLEDCDLIAEDRSFHDGPQPLLFEVLDAMDGLGPDADVAFLLTTNRADLLERALAQRPGRVDLAVEVPLPDADARRRLFALYQGALEISAEALDDAAARTEGVTASFVKEVIRRAVLLAAEEGRDAGDHDLAAAVAEMTVDAERITRSLLGGAEQDGPADEHRPRRPRPGAVMQSAPLATTFRLDMPG